MMLAWILAEAAAVTSPRPAPLQAQFEHATEVLKAGKWAEALAAFAAIEARPGISARTRGIVLLRQGMVLANLQRADESRTAYLDGLALVPKGDPTLIDDRVDALIALGKLERQNFDYAAARRHFEEARPIAPDPLKVEILVGLANVTMFEDSSAALGFMDEAVKLVSAVKASPRVDAAVRDTRARVLINRGELAAALADLRVALREEGGLTAMTDLDDVAVRSDLALAYSLEKNQDQARLYFGMTGAGRSPDGPFAVAAQTDLPPCGGNLQPDDDGVVEFGIAPDGSVSYANPIYASRQGAVARELARAVSGWTWRASEVAKVPIFYRAVTRVELRCTTTAERPPDLSLLLPDVMRWIVANGGLPDTDPLIAAGTPDALRAAIAAEGNQARLIGLLIALAARPTTDFKEMRTLLERAHERAIAQHAPAVVAAYLFLTAANLKQNVRPQRDDQFAAAIRKYLLDPEIASDARTAGTLRLILASPHWGGAYSPDAETALRAVIDDSRLPEHDPLKVGALVRLASFQAQEGQLDAARQSYLKTGLDAQQCALVDAQPAVKKLNVGSGDYPLDMMRLGVSGWTRIEFDILPDGGTANRRAVISFPPFVFGEPTIKAMARTRYTQTYRPPGALGCGGASIRLRYVMPSTK